MKFGLGCALVVSTVLSVGSADAFQINPLKNKYRGGGPGGLWEQISEPVHEEITEAALRCLAAWNERVAALAIPCPPDLPPPTRRAARGYKYDALIRGVWWNDDPNQHLFGVHYATWAAWMDNGHRISSRSRNARGGETSIGPTYKMQYRSHYGDLQFLHAMASADREAATETRRKVIDWIGFAFRVATGEIDPDATMAQVRSPIATEFFGQQPGWSVNYLFAPKFTLGSDTIAEVALGSILHVLQDSFSAAHVQRAFESSPACPEGAIVQFHAYGGQDPGRHSAADTRASWRHGGWTASADPVAVSARMVGYARSRADWVTVVEPWLSESVFCLKGAGEPSGPGSYGRIASAGAQVTG